MSEESRSKLEELSYQQGRRDADVDSRLLGHERRLNAINGSIERQAMNAERLSREIEKLGRKIDGLAAAQESRDAARDAVDDDRDESRARKLTVLQTWAISIAAVAAVVVPVLSAFIAAGKLF